MSIRTFVEGAGLPLDACAHALGVDTELFAQWADGKREIPPAYADVLSAVLGVKSDLFLSKGLGGRRVEPPAIWFKFRGDQFSDADREAILLIRRLGHNMNQLERAIEGQPNRAWDLLFQNVREAVNLQDSPQEQGRTAAAVFRSFTQFGSGGKGSSEFLRGSLRSRGILVIESPIPNSNMEGCSFLVGDSDSQRPCLFVNTFGTTWFRRNVVIMHELGHAIFDQSSGVQIDAIEGEADARSNGDKSLVEIRAESFARECLLPKNLILSFCMRSGLDITKLTSGSMAALVAFSGVEQKTVAELLRDYELIDEALVNKYQSYHLWEELKELSDRALSTREYVRKIGQSAASLWSNKRFTMTGERKLFLPVPFVKSVVDAVRSFRISIGKAAELLMIDRETFESRFSLVLAEDME